MEVDKTFIINLKYRTDRKAHMIKQLENVEIDNYEFFEAIKPTSQSDINNWTSEYLDTTEPWLKNYPPDRLFKYKLGALGCLLSHIEVMKIALSRGYKKILVLEDDTAFNIPPPIKTYSNMSKILDNQLSKIDYGILYLGGTHKKERLRKVSGNCFLTAQSGTTGSYIITEDCMKYIIDNIQQYTREVDVFFIEEVQQKLKNCYAILPVLSYQAGSYSDICQQNVNYSRKMITPT